jgi:hypothetical protein
MVKIPRLRRAPPESLSYQQKSGWRSFSQQVFQSLPVTTAGMAGADADAQVEFLLAAEFVGRAAQKSGQTRQPPTGGLFPGKMNRDGVRVHADAQASVSGHDIQQQPAPAASDVQRQAFRVEFQSLDQSLESACGDRR